MRMWKVDPSKLCRSHLLGEHNEMHMFVGAINKWKQGSKGAIKDFPNSQFVSKGQIEVHYLRQRHDELVSEMERRGMNHKSPLPEFEVFECGSIDVEANEKELGRRCNKCSFEDDGLPSESPRYQK